MEVSVRDGSLHARIQGVSLSEALAAVGRAAQARVTILHTDTAAPVSLRGEGLTLEEGLQRLLRGRSYVLVYRDDTPSGPLVEIIVLGNRRPPGDEGVTVVEAGAPALVAMSETGALARRPSCGRDAWIRGPAARAPASARRGGARRPAGPPASGQGRGDAGARQPRRESASRRARPDPGRDRGATHADAHAHGPRGRVADHPHAGARDPGRPVGSPRAGTAPSGALGPEPGGAAPRARIAGPDRAGDRPQGGAPAESPAAARTTPRYVAPPIPQQGP